MVWPRISWDKKTHCAAENGALNRRHQTTLSPINFESASDVLALATCSSHRPNEMKTNNIGGVSKNVIGDVSSAKIIDATTTATEYWNRCQSLMESVNLYIVFCIEAVLRCVIFGHIWQLCGLKVGILGTQSPRFVRVKGLQNRSF